MSATAQKQTERQQTKRAPRTTPHETVCRNLRVIWRRRAEASRAASERGARPEGNYSIVPNALLEGMLIEERGTLLENRICVLVYSETDARGEDACAWFGATLEEIAERLRVTITAVSHAVTSLIKSGILLAQKVRRVNYYRLIVDAILKRPIRDQRECAAKQPERMPAGTAEDLDSSDAPPPPPQKEHRAEPPPPVAPILLLPKVRQSLPFAGIYRAEGASSVKQIEEIECESELPSGIELHAAIYPLRPGCEAGIIRLRFSGQMADTPTRVTTSRAGKNGTNGHSKDDNDITTRVTTSSATHSIQRTEISEVEKQVDGLKALWEAGGQPWIAHPKNLAAVGEFRRKSPETRMKIIEYACWAMDRQWSDPQYLPEFHNFITSRKGERGVPVRTLGNPQQSGKRRIMTETLADWVREKENR